MAIIKKKIIFYSGSSSIVGGEAKYFFSLINGVEKVNEYECQIISDKNELFQKRSDQWLSSNIYTKYLPTMPDMQQRRVFSFLNYLFPFKIAGKEISKYLLNLFNIFFFIFLINFIYNFFIFFFFFKKTDKLDLFHCNSGSYPGRISGIAAILAAKVSRNPKIILTIHNECNRIYDPFFFIYDLIVKNCCDKIIPICENVKNSLINKKKFKQEILNVITIGLEDRKDKYELINKEKYFTNDSGFNILISGNFEEKRKGHEELFLAIKELSVNNKNVMLAIAGSGSDKRKLHLNNFAYRLGIEKNINFLGYVDDISELNSASDLVIVPSVGPEAIPYTILEGLRASKPIITSIYGGCVEAAKDGYNGFVINPHDFKTLAKKISFFIEKPDKLNEFGKNSREVFLENFLQEKKVIQHLNLYKEIGV